MQSQQTGGWDEIEFPVSLDFQIPSDFVRFNFGSGWLLLTGWDARHTQGKTWQTQTLSCFSTLVLGVFFPGWSHWGLGVQKLWFLPRGQPHPSIFVSFYSRGLLPSPRWHRVRDPAPVFQGDREFGLILDLLFLFRAILVWILYQYQHF